MSQKTLMKQLEKNYRYRASPGSHLKDKDADIIGRELHRMRASKIPVTADTVVERATEADNPLHAYFEWNDPIAAHEYRKEQARLLIRSLDLEVTTADKEYRLKAEFNVDIMLEEGESERQYISVFRVVNEPDIRAQVYQDGLREIRAWTEKYRNLGFTEFRTIYHAAEPLFK